MHSVVLLLLLKLAAATEPGVALSGMVVDAAGKPVPDATVVVAEGPPALRVMVQMAPTAAPRAPEILATGTSDESGGFSVAWPDEVPETASRRTRLTVWAYHPDSALAVRLIDRDWPRASLPLTLTLPAAASVRFKVTDANYRPVTHARITPLRVAGQLVPELLAARVAAETDAEGRATLASVAPTELETVRVQNQAIGVQWAGLPDQGRGKIVLLTLAPVGRLMGRLTLDDVLAQARTLTLRDGRLTADEARAVRRRKLHFASWQVPGSEYAGGGLA
ncbi:MAG: hypothetical protein ACREHD_20550, partial [Pirellulales bacterium]